MQDASSAFSGVAFHCYSGSVDEQDTFHTAYPTKEIYFTECSGTQGSDWWSDIKVRVFERETIREPRMLTNQLQWYMDNLYVPRRASS